MCLLVVCKPNAIPKREELTEGACANPHGFGFAIVADSKVIRYRTMSAKKAVSKFLELREQYPSGYAIWHARYATHGVKNEDNCHPYQVGDDTNTFLAHNGVLDTFISKGDKRSDTRVFAEDTLPKLGGVLALEDENIYRMIEGWASGSKIAVLTTNPQAQYQLYLINERLGTWDEHGVWWSNSSYKRTVVTPRSYYNPAPNPIADTGAFADDNFADEQSFYAELQSQLDSYAIIDECPMCEALIDIEVSVDYCQYCEACVSCGAHHNDCMCYTPHSTKSKTRELDFDNQWVRVYNKDQQALPY
jgi:hypothetical protein